MSNKDRVRENWESYSNFRKTMLSIGTGVLLYVFIEPVVEPYISPTEATDVLSVRLHCRHNPSDGYTFRKHDFTKNTQLELSDGRQMMYAVARNEDKQLTVLDHRLHAAKVGHVILKFDSGAELYTGDFDGTPGTGKNTLTFVCTPASEIPKHEPAAQG